MDYIWPLVVLAGSCVTVSLVTIWLMDRAHAREQKALIEERDYQRQRIEAQDRLLDHFRAEGMKTPPPLPQTRLRVEHTPEEVLPEDVQAWIAGIEDPEERAAYADAALTHMKHLPDAPTELIINRLGEF